MEGSPGQAWPDNPTGQASYDGVLAQVLSIWSGVLQKNVVSEDNFFLLGGDSLQASYAAVRLSEATERSVTLIDIMTQRSAGELAEWICSRPVIDGDPSPPGLSGSHRLMSIPQAWHAELEALRPDPFWRINFGFHLTGHLEPERMRSAVGQVILRYEILRSRFFLDDSGQALLEPSDFWPTLHVTTAPPPTCQAGLEVLRQFFNQPFNRLTGDVFHASLLLHSDCHWTIAFSIDHIAFDRMSAIVLLRELSVLYKSPDAAISELPEAQQFRDYSAWQHGVVRSAEGPRLRSFWREYLAGASYPALNSLEKKNIGTLAPAAGETARDLSRLGYIEKSLGVMASQIGRAEGVTPYVICLTALVLLLDAVSGQRDYVVLAPVAHRDLPRFENLIGFAANAVAVRVRWPASTSLRELLRIANSAIAASLAHSALPFPEIRRECWPAEYADRAPKATVFLDVGESMRTESPLQLFGLTAVPITMSAVQEEAVDVDSTGISVFIYRAADIWKIRMVASHKTFNDQYADGFFQGYIHTLGQVIRHPDRLADYIRDELSQLLEGRS